MKQKRFFGWLVAGLLTFGFTSCSDDDVTAGEDNNEQAKAYFQLSIATGNEVSPTESRGDAGDAEDSGTYNDGTEAEYAVTTAYVYFFKGDNLAETYSLTNFTTSSESEDEDYNAKKEIIYTSKSETVATGTYKIAVLVNQNLTSTITTLEDFKHATATLGNGYTTTMQEGHMPMSSRMIESEKGVIYKEVTLTTDNTKNNPLQLNMDVERSYAKIQLTAGSNNSNLNEYDVNITPSNKIATVELINYKLKNLTTSYYAFRHVGTGTSLSTWAEDCFGKITATNKYVIEPSTDVSQKINLEEMDYTPMPTNNPAAIYCLENTMLSDQQKKQYVTAVVFKATVTPTKIYKTGESSAVGWNEINPSDFTNVYYYNDEFFQDLVTLKANRGLGAEVIEDGDNPSTTETETNYSNLLDYGIYKYAADGSNPRVCYYTYYIKHQDNKKEGDMGVMEYAIVRNNYYKLKVTGVSLPGDTEEGIGGGEDVELEEAYIMVTLDVQPWIVRAQENINLGPQ